MTDPMALLGLAAPATAAAVAIVAGRGAGRWNAGHRRAIAMCTWAGQLAALGLVALTVWRGSITSPTLGVDELGWSVRLDALSVTMLLMITILAHAIVRYSLTYLDGDPRRHRFVQWLAITVVAVEVLVLSGNLIGLLLAWVATSLALHRLLVFFGDRRAAIVAARKKFVVARLGDGLLLGAVVLLIARFDTGDLATILEQAPRDGGGTIGLAAALLVGAAALKSAQLPVHGWLVEVMETPTPVSALLHAGILNAGPFLAIRMSPVIDGATGATVALVLLGGVTAVFASVSLLTQPSIKVALAYSSAAHMGFMLMVCGLGVYAAALLHLVAHSFYKAHAFLASGSVVDEARADRVALPTRRGNPARIVAAGAIAAALYALGVIAAGIDLSEDPVLLAIGLILVLGTTQIVAPALDVDGPAIGALRAIGAALAVTTSFFALEAGMHHVLDGTAPSGTGRGLAHLLAAGVVILVMGAVVLLQILEPTRSASPRRRALAIHMRNGLYANAVFDRVVGARRIQRPRQGVTA